MAYEDHTVNSSNPLARFAHRARTKIASEYIQLQSELKVLDFGCGDGYLLSNLAANSSSLQLVGFEPLMETTKGAYGLSIFRNWNDVSAYCDTNGFFDLVTCFEVLEHFSKEGQIELLDKICTVVKSSGELIISVPIEKGLPVIPKNLRRIATDYEGNEKIYTLKNLACSLLGIKSQSLDRLRVGDGYLDSHMGFYFNELEDVLKKKFIISNSSYSPFPKLPYFLNSQVFYKLKPMPSTLQTAAQ